MPSAVRQRVRGPVESDDDTSLDEWRWLVGLNLIGTVATVQTFLPLIRRSHGDRRIALTSSVAALRPSSNQGAYTAAKAAITSYGETLRSQGRGG